MGTVQVLAPQAGVARPGRFKGFPLIGGLAFSSFHPLRWLMP